MHLGRSSSLNLFFILNAHLSPGHYGDKGNFKQGVVNLLNFHSFSLCLPDGCNACGTHLLSLRHQEMGSCAVKSELLLALTITSNIAGFPRFPVSDRTHYSETTKFFTKGSFIPLPQTGLVLLVDSLGSLAGELSVEVVETITFDCDSFKSVPWGASVLKAVSCACLYDLCSVRNRKEAIVPSSFQ